MGQDDTKHNLLFISKYPQIIHEFTDAMKDRDIEIETAINGIEAAGNGGSENTPDAGSWTIAQGDGLHLDYDAVVSAMSQPVDEQVMEIVFTLEWASA